MDGKTKLIADGQRRAYDASIDQVRGEVEAEYAEELKKAGMWKRLQIRRKIDKGIRGSMEGITPLDGLYRASCPNQFEGRDS